jgi:hypothetical protein
VKTKLSSDINDNRGDWNHFNIILKIPEQHAGKARNQVTTGNSHTGHCTHTPTSESAKYKPLNMGNSITCAMNCN